ncbi:hypothetical protein K458DRAFT_452614 [Lentithecium fluviatile CBS 122367]|uniref:DUF4360 domain-containing protein n=1 Tax=Lentithecium fluviatile CBS 122367 TaxID=1168545 RepID=A0A6G1IYA0_9PLEO|nr:hypothetical protein K458DRAFT_452614 [Lentithecium fluviatile CBS 122367]
MRPFFAILLSALFAFIASAAPAPAATPVRPPSGTPKINKVAVDDPDVDTEGSGCRAGTVGVAFATDNSALTLIFDDFAAGVGPNSGTLRKRAFCRVNVTMSSPGWAFDVSSVDFRSYVKIAKGVEASIVSRWKWIDGKGVDMKGKGNVKKVLTGPFEDDFLLHKDGELSDSDQSVCSKASAMFQLSLSVTLTPSSSSQSGIVAGDSADVGVGELLNLSWRKC